MDKIEKIQLHIENPQQILKIDKALQRCAELLMENFIETSDVENPYGDVFELDEDWRDQLEAVFKESGYCRGTEFPVGKVFEDAIFRLAEFNDATLLRILYPVLFYTLVLKNFYNQNTVNRRAQRGSKTWGNTKKLLEVPSEKEEARAWSFPLRRKSGFPDYRNSCRNWF